MIEDAFIVSSGVELLFAQGWVFAMAKVLLPGQW